MSAIDSVSTRTPPSSSGGLSSLSSEEFLKVMLTELSKQDPLAPTDTKEILQQLGTIRSIESNLTLTRDLQTLVGQSRTTAASSLIGKYVSGRSAEGDTTDSLVASVSVTREGPILNLANGKRMPFERVEEIIDPAVIRQLQNTASGAPAASPTGG